MFIFITLSLAWFILLHVGRSQSLHFTIKVILVWLALIYIAINLIGCLTRNFISWLSPLDTPDDIPEDAKKLFLRETRLNRSANRAITLTFFVLTVAYLIAIYHYWNIALVASAALVMVSRLPDLLLEIRTGRRMSKTDRPKGAVYIIGTVIIFLTFPLTWYALYEWVP